MSDGEARPQPGKYGGARPGAGRKPGMGSRPVMTKKAVQEMSRRHSMALVEIRKTVHAGLLPLEVMLYRMRGIPMPDGQLVSEDMMDAAIAAAPYVHPKLQAIAIRPGDAALTQEERDRQQTTRSILLAELALLARPEPLTLDAESEDVKPAAVAGSDGVKPPDKWE